MFDYSKLNGRIKEVYKKQAVFAAAIGLSERTLSLKLNNKRWWTQLEIHNSCNALGINYVDIPLYFFAQEVQD